MLLLKNYNPNGSLNEKKLIKNNTQYEVTTKWLDQENPGLNVALWEIGYHEGPMLQCVYPNGWFDITEEPEELQTDLPEKSRAPSPPSH